MKLCTFGNSKYLDEHSGKIELLSPKSSYEIDVKQYLKKVRNEEKLINIKCDYNTFSSLNIPPFISLENFLIKINKDEGLIMVLINNLSIQNNDLNQKYILYCHENNTDIGLEIPLLIDFSIQFKSNIISFDYSGYGKSSGKINQNKFILNSDLVIDVLKNEFKINNENLIIFGKEIGAISALNICSKNNNINSCILFSPSFMGMINKKSMSNIIVPTFLIQAKISNSNYNYQYISKFCRSIKKEFEWTCKQNSISKIIFEKRAKLINKIKEFINIVNNKSNKNSICLSGIESLNTLPSSGFVQIEKKKNESIDLNCTYNNLNNHKKDIVFFSDEEEEDENE